MQKRVRKSLKINVFELTKISPSPQIKNIQRVKITSEDKENMREGWYRAQQRDDRLKNARWRGRDYNRIRLGLEAD